MELGYRTLLARLKTSRRLNECLSDSNVSSFAELAVGVSNPSGNYSAAEHGLGSKVLFGNPNAEQQIFRLAERFQQAKSGHEIPALIKSAQIKYLQIGVGSEMSCVLKPLVCWVANTKTTWAHLVIKHNDNIGKANDELSLCRDSDSMSEMAYAKWAAIHQQLEMSMTRICKMGQAAVPANSAETIVAPFLWADAIHVTCTTSITRPRAEPISN